MPMNRVVVRYHEVALKRTNRTEFVAQLTRNILGALTEAGVVENHRAPGRIILHLPESAAWPLVRDRVARVFGVANFLLCERFDGGLEDMARHVASAAAQRDFATFAVRTKRSDKCFPVPSPEVSARIGAVVQQRTGKQVDLNRPDLEIHVEILPREILYSFEKVEGPGGLPVDSGGTVLALLSGGIDSAVAVHRMLGRGCRVELVHFHAAPYQAPTGLEKARDLAGVLGRWQRGTRLHAVPFGDAQKQIVAAAPRRARLVLYRRAMMRIAAELAMSLGAMALVTGDSLGQVASQTLPNLVTVDDACPLPILRPLIGMDKEEIVARARRIGTYEISTLADEDCCQLWVPKHPSTRMNAGAARAAEHPLDFDSLIATALGATKVIPAAPA
jgi:tRNA uracil 4-sulfurtransferase